MKEHDCGAGGPEDCMDGKDCPVHGNYWDTAIPQKEVESYGSINIEPTWEVLLPGLIKVANDGTTLEARDAAFKELLKLARLADGIRSGAFKLEVVKK